MYGNSSSTVDCLLVLVSSSVSSAISMSLRLRRELVDEDVDPDAVCNEQAAERAESLSSRDKLIGNIVSYGENRSVIAVK